MGRYNASGEGYTGWKEWHASVAERTVENAMVG